MKTILAITILITTSNAFAAKCEHQSDVGIRAPSNPVVASAPKPADTKTQSGVK